MRNHQHFDQSSSQVLKIWIVHELITAICIQENPHHPGPHFVQQPYYYPHHLNRA
ncbi:hypothetical protein PGTUg99_018944 [Puccinia graminis f. sp. tritici]|uniref:Uncharacterized protein n=1 Tax=Puccinia graminis f. sp. tritici TaxID=56615 RepID=A0A5B0SK84_PUCGR|nr:hypothetical protein PGTUg99_018944 [Puccinia graminis f. sp. tritici]